MILPITAGPDGQYFLGIESMQNLPENCPVRDILAQIKAVLALLDKIMDHCEKCLKEKEE